MLSTTVQASPDCCLSNLMFKADKHGSILSTAAFMEVLEDNGDMQVCPAAASPASLSAFAPECLVCCAEPVCSFKRTVWMDCQCKHQSTCNLPSLGFCASDNQVLGAALGANLWKHVCRLLSLLQVWHMVFHPAGNAGLATVLAAPRYTFMHQVRRTAAGSCAEAKGCCYMHLLHSHSHRVRRQPAQLACASPQLEVRQLVH